jgi:hypothetical protein
MRKFQLFEIGLVAFVVLSFLVILTENIAISHDNIPTFLNGMISSISMIIGFSGAIRVFTLSKQWDNLQLGSARPVVYVALIGLPIVLLWTIYSNLFINGDLVYAFKLGLLDLAIASSVLVDFIGYYCRETIIRMRENSRKSRHAQTTSPTHSMQLEVKTALANR